jgi:hypothetical protein
MSKVTPLTPDAAARRAAHTPEKTRLYRNGQNAQLHGHRALWPQRCGLCPPRCCGAGAPQHRLRRLPGGTRRIGGSPIGGSICGWCWPRRCRRSSWRSCCSGSSRRWSYRGRRRPTPRRDGAVRSAYPLPGAQETSRDNGASRPLRRVPTIVSFLNPQLTFSLAGGNRTSCPQSCLNFWSARRLVVTHTPTASAGWQTCCLAGQCRPQRCFSTDSSNNRDALNAISAPFGLVQSGIIPSYAVIVGEIFPDS